MATENRLLRLSAVADNAAMPTEPTKAEPPKRQRRWFQFSLRTLVAQPRHDPLLDFGKR